VIKTFDLIKPATVSEERFLGLAQRARQIAIEIEGVYDLALYQTDGRAAGSAAWTWTTSRHGSCCKAMRAFVGSWTKSEL
jgi:hypothetical protein